MSDGHDDAGKRAILARRARFVALALASAGLGAHEASCARVCLSAVPSNPNEAGPAPEIDAGDAGDAAQAADATQAAAAPEAGADARTTDAATPVPMPCLSPMPPPPREAGPPPMVCLSVRPPQRDAGPAPMPCLSVLAPPPDAGPQPCLKVAPPSDDEP